MKIVTIFAALFTLPLFAVFTYDEEQTAAAIDNLTRLNDLANDVYRVIIVQGEKPRSFLDVETWNIWNKYKTTITAPYRKNYRHEVHYLDIKTGEIVGNIDTLSSSENGRYRYKNFKYPLNNNDIIAVSMLIPDNKSIKDKLPLAIYTHGGPKADRLPNIYDELTVALTGLGYIVAMPNYRGSTGRDDEFTRQLNLANNRTAFPIEDLQATLRYLESFPLVDQNRIVLTGISHGTYINSLSLPKLGRHLAGVVLSKGAYEGEASLDIPESLRILVTHGMKDKKHPITDMEKFIGPLRLQGNPIETLIAEQGDHHLIERNEQEMSQVMQVMQRQHGNFYASGKSDALTIDEVISYVSLAYNENELREYANKLVRFLDEIGKGSGRQFSPYRLNPVTAKRERTHFARTLVHKVKFNQAFKSMHRSLLHERDSSLENLPYTQTQSLLKISLRELYKEDDLQANIDLFLQMYTANASDILDEYVEIHKTEEAKLEKQEALRMLTHDKDEIAALMLAIIENEIAHRGKVVGVHATNSELGFVYDIYSIFRRLLLMEPGDHITRLRMLDEAFQQIASAEHFISIMDKLAATPGHRNDNYNYLPGYQEVAASINLVFAWQLSILGFFHIL